MNKSTDKPYRVFIVRCWEDQDAADMPSRFVLEIPRTGERYGFTSADTLLHALKNQLDTAPPSLDFEGHTLDVEGRTLDVEGQPTEEEKV